MTRVAECLAVGDELVAGFGVDTNSAYLARELAALGFQMRAFTVVGDAPEPLVAAIAAACSRADLVIATGGLGPTEDDRTRAAAATAAGVPLRFDAGSWTQIEARFARRGLQTPLSNRHQAMLPECADVVANDWGTAPGFALTIGRALFVALPGPPREMRAMFAANVLPMVQQRLGTPGVIVYHEFKVLGLQEAQLGERVAEWMRPGENPLLGIYASDGILTLRLRAAAADTPAARALCAQRAADVRIRLGQDVLFEGAESLAEHVGNRLLADGCGIATAESCTGGLLAGALTSVAGISRVFAGGFVTYADAAKTAELGVDAGLIERCGAVSTEVAAAMAEGAARRLAVRCGVAVTGIAGPSGGTATKPVGTVCFAVHCDGATRAWRCAFPDLGRDFIRHRAVHEALAGVLRRLSGC